MSGGPQPAPRILELVPYQPGRPVEEVERELGLSGTIKAASNENALGPSPRVVAAIAASAASVHRYPDGAAFSLVGRLAQHLDVAASRIVVGNGSNEVLELLARIFVEPGDEVLCSEFSFVVYRLVAVAAGGRAVLVPAKGLAHDLDAMADAIGERTRIIFLANPNNPTGTFFDRGAWRRFLARVPEHICVVLDEAYAEFVDEPGYASGLEDLDAHPGLVVVRTFSKAYSLAGLRLGYAVAPVTIADAFARVREPFNTNLIAQAAAIAALDDVDHLERSKTLVRQSRVRWTSAIARLDLEAGPTVANFVLLEVGDGARVAQAMLARGVIVRPVAPYGLPSMIRVTFGTEEEDVRAIEALQAAIEEVRA
ncbi:MAG: histidinol-phosphate aminotransferase [Hyphomicrobiaceae bacterium]